MVPSNSINTWFCDPPSLPQFLLATIDNADVYHQKAALGHSEKGLVKGKATPAPQVRPPRKGMGCCNGSIPTPFLMFTKFNKAVNLEQVACTPTAARNYLCFNCSLSHCNLGGLHLASNCMCNGSKAQSGKSLTEVF